MKNPRSSSQDRPWFRHAWPWALIAGPLAVVVASMFTMWIAIRSDDGVVSGDYYKRGLLVNQRLPKVPVAPPRLAATIAFGEHGQIRVRPEAGDVRGDFLRVTLTHPASGTRETLTLKRDDLGEFVGVLQGDRPGRWTMSFESQDWQLPTTLIERTSMPGVAGHVATSAALR